MSDLNGARVALLEGRMSRELANLVRRYGGEPLSAPALKEERLDRSKEVAAFIDSLRNGDLQVVLFLTGVGVSTLFKEADGLGRLPELLKALNEVTTVCRGPKPTAVLRREHIRISVGVREPYTTTEILEATATLSLRGKGVGLVHYGERNIPLAEGLEREGARLEELCLYEWHLPEDIGPLKQLVREVVAGSVDATAFTSQIQVRHLFQVAAEMGLADELNHALNTKTVVVAIGPTCAAALESAGVTPKVVPQHPKMGTMMTALAAYLKQRGGDSSD